MKKIIKQDLVILLSLIAAYHPEVRESIERASQALDCQTTREYLLLLRRGQCRVCRFEDAFQRDSPDNLFWLDTPSGDELALHLHITRNARHSPEGSAVVLDYAAMAKSIRCIMELPDEERAAAVRGFAHRSLTHVQLCSTLDFIQCIKGGGDGWK